MQNVRVPGMVHGRIVRPRGQAAYGTGAPMSQRRRELDQAHPWCAGRAQGRLRRRRCAERVRGDPGCGAAEGEMGREPTLPGSGNIFKQMRDQDAAGADHERDSGQRGRCHRRPCGRGEGLHGDLQARLPDAWADRTERRHRRREAEQRDGALLGAGHLRVGQSEPRQDAEHAGEPDHRAVLGQRRHVRVELLRRRGARSGDHVAGGREAGPRAVHALGRARLGQLRPCRARRRPRWCRRERKDRRLRAHRLGTPVRAVPLPGDVPGAERRADPDAGPDARERRHEHHPLQHPEQAGDREVGQCPQGLPDGLVSAAADGPAEHVLLGADDRRALTAREHGPDRVPEAQHRRVGARRQPCNRGAGHDRPGGELAAEGHRLEPGERQRRHRARRRLDGRHRQSSPTSR